MSTAGDSAKRPFSVLRWASSLLAPLAALVLSLPGPAAAADESRRRAGRGGPSLSDLCLERFPHHLNPSKFWDDGFALPYLLLVVLWLMLWPTTAGSPGARRMWAFTAVGVVIALIGTAISLLSFNHRTLAAAWMRFYWFRLADVAVPLGLALLGVRWLVERKMRVALALLVAVAASSRRCVVLKLFGNPPSGERQIDGDAWRAACLRASGRPDGPLFPGSREPINCETTAIGSMLPMGCRSQHTPPSACFLIPRVAYTFKWYAGRGEVVNWKETPQDAASLVAWWKRIQDIYATGNQPPLEKYYMSLADAGRPKLKVLAENYKADYLVTQVSFPLLPLP